MTVRLACVKHAASVRSEPGSNSQVHPAPRHRETKRTNPELHSRFSPVPRGVGGGKPPRKSLRLYCVCEIHLQHPQSSQPSKPGSIPAHTNQPPSPLPARLSALGKPMGRRQRIPSIQIHISKNKTRPNRSNPLLRDQTHSTKPTISNRKTPGSPPVAEAAV